MSPYKLHLEFFRLDTSIDKYIGKQDEYPGAGPGHAGDHLHGGDGRGEEDHQDDLSHSAAHQNMMIYHIVRPTRI